MAMIGHFMLPTEVLPLMKKSKGAPLATFTDADCERVLAELVKYKDTIIRGLPGLLKWSILVSDTAKKTGGAVGGELQKVWSLFFRMPEIELQVKRTPGLAKLITGVWLAEIKSFKPAHFSRLDLSFGSRLVHEYLLGQNGPENARMVIAASGLSVDALATQALSRLKIAQSHKQLFLTELPGLDMMIIDCLTVREDITSYLYTLSSEAMKDVHLKPSPFTEAVLTQKILQSYVKLLFAIAEIAQTAGYTDEIKRQIALATTFIARFSWRANSFTLMTRTIRTGILQAYLNLTPFAALDPGLHYSISDFLTKQLPGLFIWSSVLAATISAVESMDLVQKSRICAAPPGQSLSGEWTSFFDIVADYRVLFARFLKSEGASSYSFSTHCANHLVCGLPLEFVVTLMVGYLYSVRRKTRMTNSGSVLAVVRRFMDSVNLP